ncbi:MAG: hypothetical protein LBH05_04990 [Deferribacteraceae bacterium]|nr:hypothetical protein [Deferribacteraceae bacterium]
MINLYSLNFVSEKRLTSPLYGSYREGLLLPKTLLDMPNLRHLSLSHFYINIPVWLTDINFLESLEIEEVFSVNELLPHLWKLTNLRKLRLAYVEPTELPLSLVKLKYLEELNIDGADFGEFPKVIAKLSSLKSFSYEFCDCALTEVFNTLSKLPKLKKLRLTHYDDENKDYLPESFCHFQAIEELHFYDWNNLQELPECIGDMSNLRIIDLANIDEQHGRTASIHKLPDSLGNLCNLEKLDVFGLQDLKQFPSSFARLSNLKWLDIMNSGIDELQLTPDQWNNLEILRLHGTVPDLRKCANLKEFAWFKNMVRIDSNGVPSGVNEVINLPIPPLYKLESLSIMGGMLEDNNFLTFLPNLRTLKLSCDFKNFPEGFEKLSKIEDIYIWGAKSLEVLPDYLGHLPSLKRLSLTGCGVKYLPKSLQKRKDLHIEVRYCPTQLSG